MSTVRRCDNCKRIIEPNEEYFEFQVVQRKESFGYIGTLALEKEDFCVECKDKFFKRLEGDRMTDPTNIIPTPYQSGMLKPCPFCGRNMKYREVQWSFVWSVSIQHDYDKGTLIPCPMRFSRDIDWNDCDGNVVKEDIVNAQKQRFIEDWNRRWKKHEYRIV